MRTALSSVVVGGAALIANIPTSVSSFASSVTLRPMHPASSSSSSSSTLAASTIDSASSSVVDGTMPSHSPATSLPNRIYAWRGYDVRYQVSGPVDASRTILLVHGLFVNSDHWRRALTGLGGDESDGDVRVYALDLFGSGWSSKPPRDDPMAMAANGENGRFLGCDSVCYRDSMGGGGGGGGGGGDDYGRGGGSKKRRTSPILENVPMGTSWGGHRLAPTLELRHPLGSPYNFYTWAEQIADFTRDVIHADDVVGVDANGRRKVTLVANSIGTVSSLQSMIDEPTLYNGILVVNPNFRELHSAEVPLSPLVMPVLRIVQKALRESGRPLFRSLATPSAVRRILEEPYAVRDAIDDELVSVLLDPLLTRGADDVVFDALSYSAGPLPEQQLGSAGFPRNAPVWVVYGKDDPWTPGRRVENLGRVCNARPRPGADADADAAGRGGGGGSPVERVVGLDGAGHCPHDEVPDEVNGLILEFLDRLGG